MNTGESTPPSSRRRRRPTVKPGSCSAMWDESDAPAWGSASWATFWVALEQPGPWGDDALVESRLDARIGGELEGRCFDAGGRALLMRNPAESRSDPEHPPHVYVSGGVPQRRPWLLEGKVETPERLLDLPFEDLGRGSSDAVRAMLPELRPADEPVLLVCTNSKRDACCAVRGRPVVAAAAQSHPGRVWECTHTGGHRFAPTGVVLPSGATIARLDDNLAVAALAAAHDQIAPAANQARHLRGLSHLDPVAQAADAYVRTHGEISDVTALRTFPVPLNDENQHVYDVVHLDGRRWRLAVNPRPDPTPRRNSCAKEPVITASYDVVALHEPAG